MRLITKGHTNNDITNAISKILLIHISPIEEVLSYRMKRDIIDGLENIINKSIAEQKGEERKFEHGVIFDLDVIGSTGEGKSKKLLLKLLYIKELKNNYIFRTDPGRRFLSVFENNFYSFLFYNKEENIKLKQKILNFKTTMKIGLSECIKNNLLYSYPVFTKKTGEIVVEFTYNKENKAIILISGLNLNMHDFESDKKVTDTELNKELEKRIWISIYQIIKEQKKKKRKKKKKIKQKEQAKKKRQEKEWK